MFLLNCVYNSYSLGDVIFWASTTISTLAYLPMCQIDETKITERTRFWYHALSIISASLAIASGLMIGKAQLLPVNCAYLVGSGRFLYHKYYLVWREARKKCNENSTGSASTSKATC